MYLSMNETFSVKTAIKIANLLLQLLPLKCRLIVVCIIDRPVPTAHIKRKAPQLTELLRIPKPLL